MMACTDRHQRYFMRQLTRHTLLYTEMVTADAVIHGDRERLLCYNQAEHPVALQLGGSNPKKLAIAAEIGAGFGYDEINLNVGCPSDRVQSGSFGACLMAEPLRVAESIAAMRASTHLPVTVKCRIGIDDQQPETTLPLFLETVSSTGCDTFIIHARKAVLGGLSPKENREIPPLNYPLVAEMKKAFPQLSISINGGITNFQAVEQHLTSVDGVMIGRAAYSNPWLFAEADQRFFGKPAQAFTPHQVVRNLYPYIDTQLTLGTPLLSITRHLLPLFQGRPGAKAWRRHLSEYAYKPLADIKILEQALSRVPETPSSQAA